MIALAMYFACNFGIFLSYIDMDIDKEFKKEVLNDENDKRIYTNLEYTIILFFGFPMLGIEILMKAFEDDDNS